MNTKALRQKILDLAIRGKLVPQDPNDEPASELLKRINPNAEITCDIGHYPIGWQHAILGELFNHNTGKALNSSNKEGVMKNYLTTSNVYWNKFDFTVIKQMPFKESELDKCTVTKGDLLVCEGGDIGRSAIWNYDYDICIQNHIHRLRPKIDLCVPFYYYTLAYLKENNLIGGKGIGLLGLSSNALHKIEMPLPPLAEQQRIVAEIEKWFALIAQIEQGKTNLQTLIQQTKNKILDLAIHGKLVPQDPNDEPALELLKRINPNAEITCDNGHSEKLPQNWAWAKGKDIFSPMKSTKPKNEEFQYIDIDSIDNKRQIISEIKTIKTANAPSRASRYTQKNDVIFSMVRPYLRNIAKVTNDNCIASTGFYVCSSIPQILNSNYCYYLMISDNVVNGLNQFMKGDNSPSINKGHIDEWLFPLPPFAEQQRIVQKIEELFSVLDNIQKSLEV